MAPAFRVKPGRCMVPGNAFRCSVRQSDSQKLHFKTPSIH